jgi:preprotein translocase subunit SecA
MFKIFKFQKNILKEYQPLINEINFLENKLQFLTNEDLKYKMLQLRKTYYDSNQTSNEKLLIESNEKLLIESFALTREVSKRTIGLRHYDEQLLGGLILQQGKIVEMKTGEGKTLVATLPATFNALTKEGVHIVTVNDYLAKRDEAWMGPVFKNLGLTVGLIETETPIKNRKNAYSCDITYINNSELGFDFLRDNLAYELNDTVQRPFNYCIMDEIDSILIDESRTPLVISGLVPIKSNIYIQACEISKYLEKFIDFEIDERLKNIILTEAGYLKLEKILNIENIFESEKPWLFHINNALKASNFYLKDVDYIVKDNQINIIDEFTGRLMPDRRWDKGLHEAIEAKENILINNSSQSLASITYQNFFTLYPKLSGMTGTAKTAEQEFINTYQLEVFVLPTHLPFKREDLPDRVYKNESAKWKSVVKESILLNKTGRPILIGTNTIEKSEIVSLLLKNYNVRHKVLNAKPENLMFESDIIAQAGCKNAITIATNMAGRGTDIILGGTVKHKTKKLIKHFFDFNSIAITQTTLIFFS